jgi:hypothetical protein
MNPQPRLGMPPKSSNEAEEKRLGTVILSEAKNLGSCIFNELRRSFVAGGSSG